MFLNQKNDAKFNIFLWYVNHKMTTKYYINITTTISLTHQTDEKRTCIIKSYTRENCSPKYNTQHRIGIPVQFPLPLLRTLLELMSLSTSVQIIKNMYGIDVISVTAPYYTALHIESAIKYAIETTLYRQLSVSDANKIIEKLGLSRYVYCIEGHQSGACLVVFETIKNIHQRDPHDIFREMVNGIQKMGRSSTETIQSCMQEQLQLQAMEAQMEAFKKTKSELEQAIRLKSNSTNEKVQLTRTNAQIEQLEQRMRVINC
jgi:Skp family chaperone for outer membrane proteins